MAVGILLPWLTGIAVKVYLQAHGKDTIPWSYFFEPSFIPTEIWATAWFVLPYVALALIARFDLFRRLPLLGRLSEWERCLIVLCGLAWGAVATAWVFVEIFWVLEPMLFVFPYLVLPVLVYVVAILLGLAVGLGVVGVRRGVRWVRTRPST